MKIFGEHDDNTLAQLTDVDDHAELTALMADGHLGYSMPIGGVAAFRRKVSVSGVGYDIACGNCAVQLDLHIDQFPQDGWGLIGAQIQHEIAAGVGKANRHPKAPTDHPLFEDDRWSIIPPPYREPLLAKARTQLGSLGSGNHYVDVLVGTDGRIWVAVHFGSRGFGHTIASNFIVIAEGGIWGGKKRKRPIGWGALVGVDDEAGRKLVAKADMALLDLDDQAGQDYWDLMELAGDYAYAGRDWVCDTVADIISTAPVLDRVHNNHNFAWRETHHGESLVIVRKGATPAWPGQLGFVGGSMGDDAVILKGADSFNGETFEAEFDRRELQRATLYSTVHGAGRVMSRTKALGRTRWGKVKGEPAVDRDEVHEWLAARNVLVYGADLDEAPQAYRRLNDVIRAQGATVVIEETLRPLIVVMASADFDETGAPTNPFLQ